MKLISPAASMAWVLLASAVQAQVSTLSLPSENQYQFNPSIDVGSAFGTGSTPFQVSQITAKLVNSNPDASSAVVGSIYLANSSKLPSGSPLGTLTMSAPLASFGSGDVVFTPDAPLVLPPNGSYLFVLSSLFGNWSWWETRGVQGFITPGGDPWSMPTGVSVHQGVPPAWTRSDDSTIPPYDYRNQLSIQGAPAVPEPSTTAVAVGGCLMIWSLIRQTRKSGRNSGGHSGV